MEGSDPVVESGQVEEKDPTLELLIARLGEAVLGVDEDKAGTTVAVVERSTIKDACRTLRDCPEQFSHLSTVCGVDYSAMGLEPRYAVVYHLYSPTAHRRFVLKVPLEESDAKLPSVVEVFPTADWHERETYDMFGIEFEGHPNMIRILLPEDADFFPLRKDFPLGEEEIEFSHNSERLQRERAQNGPEGERSN